MYVYISRQTFVICGIIINGLSRNTCDSVSHGRHNLNKYIHSQGVNGMRYSYNILGGTSRKFPCTRASDYVRTLEGNLDTSNARNRLG